MTPALMKYLIWPLVKFLVAFVIVQVIVAAMNWIERRLLGLMQARLGPNRVGWSQDGFNALAVQTASRIDARSL